MSSALMSITDANAIAAIHSKNNNKIAPANLERRKEGRFVVM
jgi:hypothetical protein